MDYNAYKNIPVDNSYPRKIQLKYGILYVYDKFTQYQGYGLPTPNEEEYIRSINNSLSRK